MRLRVLSPSWCPCVVYNFHNLYLLLLLYNGLKWWDLEYTKNNWVGEQFYSAFWFVCYIHRIGNSIIP